MLAFTPTKAEDLTARQVIALRDEAGAAGDIETRDLCDRVLSPRGNLQVGGPKRGSVEDLELIAEIITDARAARWPG